MSSERKGYRGYNKYLRNYNNRESRNSNPNWGWRTRQHQSQNNHYAPQTSNITHHSTSHRGYNESSHHRYRRNYQTNPSHSQSPSPNVSYNKKSKERQIVIDAKWRKITYIASNNELKTKICQIIANGQRCRDNCTLTEYLVYYGKYIVHTNITGDIISFYEGGWDVWEQWFWYFLGGNMQYENIIFSEMDLFGASTICGKDICNARGTGYAIIEGVCKRGWLHGLKSIIEKRKINHIDEKFKLLIETAYRFNDDILRYLMVENNFYNYFDVDAEVSEYNETLWVCCRDQLEKITKPGSGWLHCLESLHYAPVLIQKIHGENMVQPHEQDEEKEIVADNWMLKELMEISLNVDNIKLPKQYVEERLNIIQKLRNNEQVKFKLESCYYGLCADAASGTLHYIHFWKPHVDRADKKHSFEYIPVNDGWGRLRMSICDDYFLTVIANKNIVKFGGIMTDDSQLWRIEQVKIENEDEIWIRIINKVGYKLIFSWKQHTSELSNSMPVLSISDKIDEIDELCNDIFSVSKNNYTTRYRLYFEKYQHVTNRVILNGIAGLLNRHSFWRLYVDGSKLYPKKFDCYKEKAKNIAKTLWQFKERYIQSLYTNNKQDDKQDINDTQPQIQQRPPPPRRAPPKPPTQLLYKCSRAVWNDKICPAMDNVYISQENLRKYILYEYFESREALYYYLCHTVAMQIIDKQAIVITFIVTGKWKSLCLCLMNTDLHKNGKVLYIVIVNKGKKKKKLISRQEAMIIEAFMTAKELLNKYGIIESDLPVSSRGMHNDFEELKSNIEITSQLIMDTNWKQVEIITNLDAFDSLLINSDILQISVDRFEELALQSLREYYLNNRETSILQFIFVKNEYRLETLLPIFIPEYKKWIAISFGGTQVENNKNKTIVIGIYLDLMDIKNKARLIGRIADYSWLNRITDNNMVNNFIIVDTDHDISENTMNVNQIKEMQQLMGLHDILGDDNVRNDQNNLSENNFKYNVMSNNETNICSEKVDNIVNPMDDAIQQLVYSNDILGWLMVVKLPQYYDMFIEEGFEDFETILEIEEADLIEMNINKKEHRFKILDAVQQIRSNTNIKI